MKRALIVVSFGTTYFDESKKTIGAVENKIRENFPDRDFFRAYTSGMVVSRLAERGIKINTLEDVLYMTSDYDEVLIQPTHIIKGFEFDKIINGFVNKTGKIPRYIIGEPLLSSEDDFKRTAELLNSTLAPEAGSCTLLVAHGTAHRANESYLRLGRLLKDNMFILTLEGDENGRDCVLSQIKDFSMVTLAPLLLVSGDHANNDIFADNDSIKARLRANGQDVAEVRKSLGEYEQIQNIFAEHSIAAAKML